MGYIYPYPFSPMDGVKDEILDRAMLLIETFSKGLKDGVKHYRKSDGKLLTDLKEVLTALREEKIIEIEFPKKKGE